MNSTAYLGKIAPSALQTTPGERAPRPASDAGQTGAPVSAAERAKIEHAAEQFEAVFIRHMLREMRSGLRELAGDSSVYGRRTNQDMLEMADTLFADSLASRRAFGIADLIVRQMLPSTAGQAAPRTEALKHSDPPVASER